MDEDTEIQNLLKLGQAKEVLERYERFVENAKPFDDAMGYLKKDGVIYNAEAFVEVVRRNLSETDQKKFDDILKKGDILNSKHAKFRIKSSDFLGKPTGDKYKERFFPNKDKNK